MVLDTHRRYLQAQVVDDLARKMVFLSGPRQVGKTTLALALPGGRAGYLTWDDPDDRDRILRRRLPRSPMWIFDEIHKYRPWRGYLKGIFDKRNPAQRILVTGSGRLDFYRFGGDSLQGRYHLLRLHPFSVAELGLRSNGAFKDLLALGGFPEPFLSGSLTAARRWSRQYRSRVVQDDVATLERMQDLGSIETLMLRLPGLVGSPLSINGVREDLLVSHKTVSTWLDVLERVYAIFRVAPFGAPRIRAIKKVQKHYHWDWSVVPDAGPRFENLVASHILKWVHYRQDVEGLDLDLRYFRDLDGREVDFVVIEGRRPILMVECKASDRDVALGLRYLKAKFPACDAWQVSADGTRDYQTPEGIRVSPARSFLGGLV